MTETGYKDHRVLIDSLRNSLNRRGFKSFLELVKLKVEVMDVLFLLSIR